MLVPTGDNQASRHCGIQSNEILLIEMDGVIRGGFPLVTPLSAVAEFLVVN